MSANPVLVRKRNRWILIAGAAIALFYGSGIAHPVIAYQLASGNSFHAGIRSATLSVGWEESDETLGVGWNWSWYFGGFYADNPWRPYHVAQGPWPDPSRWHDFVVPIWPVPAFALAGLLFAQGRISGTRFASLSICQSCGYDLSGQPKAGVDVRCPECGTGQIRSAA